MQIGPRILIRSTSKIPEGELKIERDLQPYTSIENGFIKTNYNICQIMIIYFHF